MPRRNSKARMRFSDRRSSDAAARFLAALPRVAQPSWLIWRDGVAVLPAKQETARVGLPDGLSAITPAATGGRGAYRECAG